MPEVFIQDMEDDSVTDSVGLLVDQYDHTEVQCRYQGDLGEHAWKLARVPHQALTAVVGNIPALGISEEVGLRRLQFRYGSRVDVDRGNDGPHALLAWSAQEWRCRWGAGTCCRMG